MARMKQFFKIISFLLACAILMAACVALYVAYEFTHSKASPESQGYFIVEKGMGIVSVAQKLKDGQQISNPYILMAAAVMKGRHRAIQAGEYEIPPNISMQGILQKMITGDVVQRRFTIPEGFTAYEAVTVLQATEFLEGDIVDLPAEGSLLPETYHYNRGDTRAGKIIQMQLALDKAMAALWPNRMAGLPFTTQQQALVLASIVEKETGVASERKAVAGVFINRLRQGMPLQSDPTVIYAITKGKHDRGGMGPLGRRLLKKDLEIDSPYNTYKYAGLPPAPIANVGRASLEAVLNPASHDFLYFVADGKGGHAFAKTLDEHNQNVEQWRKIRDSEK